MPKPLTMTIHVEEIAFGKVYRLLDGMEGVAQIDLHGSGPKKSARPNGAHRGVKKGGSQTVPCLILGALIEYDKMSREELVGIVVAAGKKESSVPDGLNKCKKARWISITGKHPDAVYKITAAGRKHFATACEIENGE